MAKNPPTGCVEPNQFQRDQARPKSSEAGGQGKNVNSKMSPRKTPRPGILQKVTAADLDLVEFPALAPHFEFRPIDDGQVLLVSETFNTLLRERIHSDLLALLDGHHSHHDITAALAGTYVESEVQAAIASLVARGYVVSGDYLMERERAAFWSSLGASPRWAENRLAETKVEVIGDDGHLVRKLDALGIAVGTDHPDLSVIVCEDYLGPQYAETNQRHLASGGPWMLVQPKGIRSLFGPVFRPLEQGPCWACLTYRMRGHQEVHNFLRNLAGDDGAFLPFAAEPAVLDAIYGLVAVEVAKWVVLEELAPLHERAISLNTARLKSEHHSVMRRPQCFECGDEALYSADRPPVPVQLRASPKNICNSGGLRSVTPEETLARYRHLISSVSGIVSWVTRTTEETDPWLHVYWAGSNFALKSRNLSSLRRSLRSKSAGKGSTPRQSEASALCEAVERYCGSFHGDEIRHPKRFSDFDKARGSEAIHPNDVQLFSDWQLDHAEEINAGNHPYNVIPSRFDPDAEMDWSPVWSLTQNRYRYLPTSMLYSVLSEHQERSGLKADSNGCAAGNTLEEAILQGFFELVERDAFAVWWYNQLHMPGVGLDGFDDEYLASATDRYRDYNRELWVLDVTNDLGIPVFVAVSRRTDKEEEDIIYAAGAHTDPHIAALRAVCELNQFLNLVQGRGHVSASAAVNDPMCRWWWGNARLEEHSYLVPDPGARPKEKSDYSVPDTTDTKEDVERCRAMVESKGMEFLVLDQTRPDIGMPVARVMVPGLRHFWPRYAPGRLFEVPVEMKWRENPIAEADLNPAPVIA